MNGEVRCPCCKRLIEAREWQPYRVQDKLYICFECDGIGYQIEARFMLAQPDRRPTGRFLAPVDVMDV